MHYDANQRNSGLLLRTQSRLHCPGRQGLGTAAPNSRGIGNVRWTQPRLHSWPFNPSPQNAEYSYRRSGLFVYHGSERGQALASHNHYPSKLLCFYTTSENEGWQNKTKWQQQLWVQLINHVSLTCQQKIQTQD